MKTMLANSYNETSCQVQKKSKLNAIIRPILKYASSVWSPHNNASLSTKIEMVQRKACRWIENKWEYHHSPTPMLKCLNLDPLELRRELSCLKMLFDITNGFKYMDKALLPIQQRTLI